MVTKKAAKAKRPPTPETIVTRACNKFLRDNGWRLIRNQRTSIPGSFSTGEPGMPDFQAIRYFKPGVAYMFWIEYKAPGSKIRAQQAGWHEQERSIGASVVVFDSAFDLERWYEGNFGFLHAKEPKQKKLL